MACFGNLKIVPCSDGGQFKIDVSWNWTPVDQNLPRCSVFICVIPERTLLQNMIFTKSELIEWFNGNVVDVKSIGTHGQNIRQYVQRPQQNREECSLNEHQMMRNGPALYTTTHTYGSNYTDKLFFVCVYDDTDFRIDVVSLSSGSNLQYTIEERRTRLLGPKRSVIKFEDGVGRQRVLVTRYQDGSDVYSVLPNDTDEYYLDQEFDKSGIKRVTYLSSLI